MKKSSPYKKRSVPKPARPKKNPPQLHPYLAATSNHSFNTVTSRPETIMGFQKPARTLKQKLQKKNEAVDPTGKLKKSIFPIFQEGVYELNIRV